MTAHRIGLLGLLLLGLIGCVPAQMSGASSSSSTATARPEKTELALAAETETPVTRLPVLPGRTPEPVSTPSSPGVVDKFIGLAKTDLAGRLKIEIDQINVIEVVSITWPDAALGCPVPGKVYAQGRVPGYRIGLAVVGRNYAYHTDQTGQVVLCPDVKPDEIDILPGPTPQIGVPIK